LLAKLFVPIAGIIIKQQQQLFKQIYSFLIAEWLHFGHNQFKLSVCSKITAVNVAKQQQ